MNDFRFLMPSFSNCPLFGATKKTKILFHRQNQILATRLVQFFFSFSVIFFLRFSLSLFISSLPPLVYIYHGVQHLFLLFIVRFSSYAFIWISSRFAYIFICSFVKMKMMRLFYFICYHRSVLFVRFISVCVCICMFHERTNEYFFYLFVCLLNGKLIKKVRTC